MSKFEMIDLVYIMEKHDYDGKLQNYYRPNTRKDQILEKVRQLLQKKHGVKRSKDQLRKRWSDLKHREKDQLDKIHRTLAKRKFILFYT